MKGEGGTVVVVLTGGNITPKEMVEVQEMAERQGKAEDL